MKCIHNKEIRVLVELSGDYWDDGIIAYDKDGVITWGDGDIFLRIDGCDKCKQIEYVERWPK